MCSVSLVGDGRFAGGKASVEGRIVNSAGRPTTALPDSARIASTSARSVQLAPPFADASMGVFMARSGDVLTNRAGHLLRFRQTGGETGGALLEVEALYPPRSQAPTEHYHPSQEERFEVLQGEMKASIDGSVNVYGVGETYTIPPGTRHWMHNASDEPARILWQTRPALRTETFFETTWGLARDGQTRANGSPKFLQAVVVGQAFAREFRLARPPYLLQQILFFFLAPLGRLVG